VWFKVRQDDVEMPSGATIDGYYVWESPHIATVVPVTTDKRFVLCRQYRHAVGKVMLQFPAGIVGAGESPEAAARRELEEETGYTAGELEHLGDIAVYPTKLSGWHHLYLARDVQPGGTVVDDPHEPIEVVLASTSELYRMVDTNQFQVGDSVAAALLATRRLNDRPS
jgi:8-oxo-dGTP pyrophosphatase MutT (NUDIX family)